VKDVLVDANGELRCPVCNGRNFDLQRTKKAKIGGYLAVGVGVMLMPKRMTCLACGAVSKSGNAKQVASRPSRSSPGRSSDPPVLTQPEWESQYRSGLLTDAEYTEGCKDLALGSPPSMPHRTDIQDLVLETVGVDRRAVADLVRQLDAVLQPQQALALVDAVDSGPVLIARRVDVTTAVEAISTFRQWGSAVRLENRY